MGLTNIQLAKIASIGGVIVASTGYLTRWKINDRIKQTEYYQEAINTLKTNKAAIHLLGEPIKDGSVDVTNNERNFTSAVSAKLEVPVKGPNQKGYMYFWASRESEQSRWNVYRIELSLKDDPSRRLLVKNSCAESLNE